MKYNFFGTDSSSEMTKTLRYFTDVFGYFAREKNALLRDVLLVHIIPSGNVSKFSKIFARRLQKIKKNLTSLPTKTIFILAFVCG